RRAEQHHRDQGGGVTVMDDRNPQPPETLDDLAELFLTEPDPDALAGPGPIKLPPKAAASAPPPPPRAEEPADPAAADYRTPDGGGDEPRLRLAGDEPRPTDRAAGPIVANAEAVVLGNLPGMAGPWLTQYGQLLAQQDGAVAILHVDACRIDLELVEPTQPAPDVDPYAGPAAAAPTLRVPPGGFAGRDLLAVLDQLCAARVAPVRTVLVHLDPTPESLPKLLSLDYWTLLSGADDAAIVAGYRLLKRLLEANGDVARAHVGLMVVGSDRPAGQDAARKLRAAVANFLRTPLELIGYQQKMIPARCRTLGSFPDTQTLWPRLAAWLADLETPTPGNDTHLAAAESPAVRSSAGLPPLAEPVHLDALEPEPPAEAADQTSNIKHQKSQDLFSLIDSDPRAAASIPGGLALEARCPSQPHTQLALDGAGRLHLLHRHDSAEGDPPTPREAIVELVAVRDWARQHRDLLRLTERARHFDPDADPVLHLFTDRADLSVHLVARLGELLKLHLLRDVAVGDTRTTFCTPLSA
ncbi:MAG: hypothetical protein AAF800_13275, partial [Planctomycetota bacterium]